jgi:hypothetical protein
MENSNDVIGNRPRDLSACSAVLQPTAPPLAFHLDESNNNINPLTPEFSFKF